MCGMVTNWKPRCSKVVIIVGKAATVSDRSPPPSCMRMIEPLCVEERTFLMIASVPGRDQSFGSTFHKIVERPRLAAMDCTVLLKLPPGGRNRVGDAPVSAAI